MRLDHLLSKEKSTLKIVRKSFDCLILRGLQDFSREFFENYTVKENGSFSEIKQKKESSLLYIEIYAKEQFEKLQEVMRTYHSQI